jgi:hypothetical protein
MTTAADIVKQRQDEDALEAARVLARAQWPKLPEGVAEVATYLAKRQDMQRTLIERLEQRLTSLEHAYNEHPLARSKP